MERKTVADVPPEEKKNVDVLLNEFETSIKPEKKKALDIEIDKEAPLSEKLAKPRRGKSSKAYKAETLSDKLTEEEIEAAVQKKKKAEWESAIRKRIEEIRKKEDERRKKEEEPEPTEEEKQSDEVKREEIIRRIKQILALRGEERARALAALSEEFSPKEVMRLAAEYVQTASRPEEEAKPQLKKEETPAAAAPQAYGGRGAGVYAEGPGGAPEEKGKEKYAAASDKVDFSAKKALEETYHVKKEDANIFDAKKQLENTYGKAAEGEKDKYCEKCEKKGEPYHPC